MPLLEEHAWTFFDRDVNGHHTATWDFRFPPRRAIAKVFLAQFWNLSDSSYAIPFFQSYYTRLPDGTDQQTDIPNVRTLVLSHDALSGFVVGMMLNKSDAGGMVVYEIWG